MTPTLKQRVGLAPVRLDSQESRRLLAARVGSALFALEASLVLLAAAIGGGGDSNRLFVACGGAYGLALLFLLSYERLDAIGANVIALAGTVSISILVTDPELGASYRILYVWPALYVAFFMPRRQAALQLIAIVGLSGVALAVTLPSLQVLELWIVSSGILIGATAFTGLLRDYLVKLVDKAHRHRATLDAYFRHASTGFAFLDRDFRRVRVNEPLAAMLGSTVDELTGRTVSEIAPHYADALEPLLRRVLETGEALEGLELESSDGKRHYLVSYYAVTGADGSLALGETVVEVTHLKDVERRLEETNRRLTVLATTDELTQLPNRRMLDEQLELAFARARRHGLAVAVLAIDLDRFKDVNDTLGHAYGDRLLVEVAGCLRASARETDVVARIGGDEFLILLADLDVQDAPVLAQTVVDRIAKVLSEPLAIDPVELRVQASIGVAIYPTDSRDAKGLLAIADAAMYAGKAPLAHTA